MNAALKTETLAERFIRPFIESLERLYINEERGALAALRRGLGKAPGTAMEMYPYVVPFTKGLNRRQEDAFYVVGALFGLYPSRSWRRGEEEPFTYLNLGASLRRAGAEGVERRFIALLNCHAEDLPNHLRQTVSLLESKDIPIEWAQLLDDVLRWDFDDNVRRNWARAFWVADSQTENATADSVPETINSTEE